MIEDEAGDLPMGGAEGRVSLRDALGDRCFPGCSTTALGSIKNYQLNRG
ncbi:hypothetical protein ACU4GR_22685 [Methylobacterium oryzae CBMB20]